MFTLITIGGFEKTLLDGGNQTAMGNEQNILNTVGAGITVTAAAANDAQLLIPLRNRFLFTKFLLRATTAVADATTITPVIKVSYAVQGTATLADSTAALNITTANLGSGTGTTIDYNFTPFALAPGSFVVLRHVAGTGSPVAGVVQSTSYMSELEASVTT